MKTKVLIIAFCITLLLLSGCVIIDSSCPSNVIVVEEEGMLRCYEHIRYDGSIACGVFDVNIDCAKIEYELRSCPNACINSYKEAN